VANDNADTHETPFHDLDAYVALPRTSGLAISPTGDRLVTSVATLNPDGTKYVTALWEVDPAGERPARRLTRSAKGEAGAAFLPGGDLLFTSARPDPEAKDDDDEVPLLWLLPTAGGEARVVAKRPGGIGGVKVAREAGTILVSSDTFPSSESAEDDEAKRKDRKDRKVSAILHEQYPVRYWDQDLGPDVPRLFVGSVGPDDAVELRDLTPDAGPALTGVGYDISPNGSTVVSEWKVFEQGAARSTLVAIDVATGERRVLADHPEYEYGGPAISPDGALVVAIREAVTTPSDPPDQALVIVSLADGSIREVAADWDRWPATTPRWTPDGSAVIVTADDHGRAPIFRIDVESAEATRLTADAAAYTDVVVSPDGNSTYALRTSYLVPADPVRLDPRAADQTPVTLQGPAPAPALPGRLTELSTTAADGVRVRAWLALPEDAADRPAPLLLWVHGGPLHSWNAWAWRWNPWLMVARGYAVLLPDPALSTGYGLDFVRRGWGSWGEAPFTDLMAITDAAVARDDIDASRTAAMGGSFGGYMANWIAGHTDRFNAIVTHASLWALDQFSRTTDGAWYWEREMSTEMIDAHSPHHSADAITTPMLVIHGDKDYRVPIGEALRLWRDLVARTKPIDGELQHKFLYFPDENHWILSPGHAKVWYETVFAFLAHHVLGEEWEAPAILR
jgi:dipeptidyl aminopeptidase/acylaminoacyl peptidase